MRAILFSIALMLSFGASQAQIIVTEINYNSDSASNSGSWFEIYNAGSSSVDLTNWQATDNSAAAYYNFPNSYTLAAGSYMVLVGDPALFTAEYPGVSNYMGTLPFGLGNSSDGIQLLDDNGNPVYSVTYYDSFPWPKGADGLGKTLEFVMGSSDPLQPESWFAGCIGGSPGGPFVACNPGIVFSEINYNSMAGSAAGDWVELHNTTTNAIDLSGWEFRDSKDTNHYYIPNGTSLAVGGYLVLIGDSQQFISRHPSVTNFIGQFPFSIDNSGDRIRLFNAQKRLIMSVIFRDSAPWPVTPDGLGYTLELLSDTLPTDMASTWFAGCPEGSPGKAFDPGCGVGINEVSSNEFNIQLWPNPASDAVQITFDNQAAFTQLQLLSAEGRVMAQNKISASQTTLSLKNFPAGFYFVKLSNEHTTSVKKLLVK